MIIYSDIPEIQKAFLLGYAFQKGFDYAKLLEIAEDARHFKRDKLGRFAEVEGGGATSRSRAEKHTPKTVTQHKGVIEKHFRPSYHTVTGDDIHRVTKVEMDEETRNAVLEYTSDEKTGANCIIGDELRKEDGDIANLPEEYQGYIRTLDAMIENSPPLENPIRVYRGVPRGFAEGALKYGVYRDDTYTSTSTNINVAAGYNAQAVLVCDIPAGHKCVSVRNESTKPQDEEVLLPRNVLLKVKSHKEVNGVLYVHVEKTFKVTENGNLL